jgi:hypothetical protein
LRRRLVNFGQRSTPQPQGGAVTSEELLKNLARDPPEFQVQMFHEPKLVFPRYLITPPSPLIQACGNLGHVARILTQIRRNFSKFASSLIDCFQMRNKKSIL